MKLFELMSERGISAKKLSEDTKISQGNISDWKSGRCKPSFEKIQILASYFNVSTDYLLGTEQKNKSLSAEQDKLLNLYNSLGEDGKAILLQQAEILLKANQ